MKLIVYLAFMTLCFTIVSCSHNAYDDFEKVNVGDDKGELLEKAGSPLRSVHVDGEDIWTYRFYVDDQMIYKDVTLQNDRITTIHDTKETDFKAVEEKEKKIEAELKKAPREPLDEKSVAPRKKIGDSQEPAEQKPKTDDFEPVN